MYMNVGQAREGGHYSDATPKHQCFILRYYSLLRYKGSDISASANRNNMKHLTTITLTSLLLLSPILAFATEGKVIEYKAECGYLLIEGTKGYLLVKQQGAGSYLPRKDDLIDGFFLENYGITHLHKIANNQAVLWVYNEYSWLSKDDATNKYVEKCGPIEKHPLNNTP